MNYVIRIPTTMRPVREEDIARFEEHYAKHVVQWVEDEVTQLPGYEVTEHSADEVEEIELPCFLREQAGEPRCDDPVGHPLTCRCEYGPCDEAA